MITVKQAGKIIHQNRQILNKIDQGFQRVTPFSYTILGFLCGVINLICIQTIIF